MKVSFDRILGQKLAKTILKKAIEKDKLAPVYLFQGPQGTGKASLAVEFAKAILCRDKEIRPCNRCGICRRVGDFIHPDFWILLPSKVSGDTKELTQYWKLRNDMGKDGWIRPKGFDRTLSISHHLIRMIQEEMTRYAYESERRIILVLDADLLTQVAQNNLLKVLEENPTNTHFIMVTSRPHMVLSTIRSRSQLIPFTYLNFEEFIRFPFKSNLNKRVIYRLSGGSIGEARELLESPWLEKRKDLVDLLNDGDNGKFSLLFKESRGNRKEVMAFIKVMGSLLKDTLQLKLGVHDQITNVDLLERLKTVSNKMEMRNIERMILELGNGEEALRNQANPDLVLATLLSLPLQEKPEISDFHSQ